ncbi:hypothetical protein ACOJTA_02515 [Malaciobacter sp. WC5094]|uniref:hypothetical protein n=1 Tax=Arcobacter sp. YIC-80 TaxID=3376683 RepID=UPI003850C919
MRITSIKKRLKIYQITSILSILLTLVGFSYNVYRLEQTEINSNIRTSSFEMLKELANLEQIVYASHYEKDDKIGNPRIGWVKVGIIQDLSIISFKEKNKAVENLLKIWEKNWSLMKNDRQATNRIIKSIDEIRKEIRIVLKNLN